MSQRELSDWALNIASLRGAQYAEARIVDSRQRKVSTKNCKVSEAAVTESLGIGIRVLVNGSWGFAATNDLSRKSVESTAASAVAIGRASRSVQSQPVSLVPEPAVTIDWTSPCQIDPLTTSIEQNLELLVAIDRELLAVKGVTLGESKLQLSRYEQWFYNSAGSAIHQTRHITGAGFVAQSFQGSELQRRSYPNCFGGLFQNKGYELVHELNLIENARRIGEQAVALHRADQCPAGPQTLVLDSSQVGLQVHESIGHAIELDRVLGCEVNFAGTSFATTDKLRNFQYGSGLVNVVADATEEHGPGLGTFAYDDEGVKAQCTPVITRGLFTGYLLSRETAQATGAARSNGSMRAEGWQRTPIIRMTNISILPGETPLTLDQLLADTEAGIYMETNRSWSIDDKRYNFQFGCEAGWEIKGGKLGRMLKNPSYSGTTPAFWNSMDAICSRDAWVLWGLPNCGKGQPRQTMGTGHGAAPARFRNVTIGSAYKKVAGV